MLNLFVIKRIAIVFSMILLSYVGEGGEDARSFFLSWFIFLFLIVADYTESLQFKKFQKDSKIEIGFYYLATLIFGFLTALSLMGSFGLILLSEELTLVPNSDFVIMDGLFLLTFGNTVSVNVFIWSIAVTVAVFFVVEMFMKPVLSYKEKHKIKYRKKGEIAS